MIGLALVLAAAPAQLPTIFGIELGAPIALPACLLEHGRADLGYSVDQPVTCVTPPKAEPRFDRPWPSSTIWFPLRSAPDIVKSFNLQVLVADNRAAGISFYTAGATDQELVLAQLSAKFGPPTTKSLSAVQNASGASFQAVHAVWSRPGFTVRFEGMTDRVDDGEVTIDTPIAAAIRQAARRADEASRPKL